jgi:squalene synthase HpnC
MGSATRNRFEKPAPVPTQAIDDPAIVSRAWPVDDSYGYCEKLARSHYENFPVGSVLIKKVLRKHFYAIYAFARIADDFADEAYDTNEFTESERLGWLNRWRDNLKDAYAGRAKHPVFVALAETAVRFALPIQLFEDLLSAFSQDVSIRRYRSYTELMDYCRRSANPVGRLILLLFGHRDPEMHSRSDDICTALQLANHWQDVAIDLEKDRVYIPSEDMLKFGLTVDSIKKEGASDRFKRLMSFEVERARRLFLSGKPLCTSAAGRLGVELRAVWLGGMTILDRLEKNGFDMFAHRPVISSRDKLKILSMALRKRAFESYQ